MPGLAADAVLVLQAALVLAVLESVRRRNTPAIANGLGALGVALLPAALDAATAVALGPELPVWIAVAGLVHTVGMLGLYDAVWWWDHLAHAVTAGLVTALVYAAVLVAPVDSLFGALSPLGVTGVTLGFVTVFAVLWELVEELARHVAERYDMGPLLVIYGPYDAVFDLAFNLVGAGLVLLLDLRLFVPVFEPYPQWAARLLWGASSVGLGAVALLTFLLYHTRDDWP